MRRAFTRDLVPSWLVERIDAAEPATLFLGLASTVFNPALVGLLGDFVIAIDAVHQDVKIEPSPFENPNYASCSGYDLAILIGSE